MSGVLEKFSEFDRLAGMLQMPSSERLGILNISEEFYAALQSGSSAVLRRVQPELERRLSYALPLMRRLASNTAVVRLPVSYRCAA